MARQDLSPAGEPSTTQQIQVSPLDSPPLLRIDRQLSAPPQSSSQHSEAALTFHWINDGQRNVSVKYPVQSLTLEARADSAPPVLVKSATIDQQVDRNAQHITTTERFTDSVEPKAEHLEGSNTPDRMQVSSTMSEQYQSHEHDGLFVSQKEGAETMLRGHRVRQLAQDDTPERLEAGVQAGLRILSRLEESLTKLNGNEDVQVWLSQLAKVRKDAVKTRIVVGVVGSTGAGKSSVINAVCDEERLVPTNCMRACTAVVTELSYNDSNSEFAKYRAEIEFIKPEDWQAELDVLFQEVFDENGRVSREVRKPDSQAAIAYAKIRGVYYKHTREMLANATVGSLMKEPAVKSVLGKAKKINESEPSAFYSGLQTYVDSKEKVTGKLDKYGKKVKSRKRAFEHWPLIKVVRIYTKAEALACGTVLVDLPGVQDANAARAAVAERYMTQCARIWIVAPITRAVDDKSAKVLLGTTFKRQLKYDGTYSSVTFIASKSDDISTTEAADTLKLPKVKVELDELRPGRQTLQERLEYWTAKKQRHEDVAEDLEQQMETWEELEDQHRSGQTVYRPSTSEYKKRKRQTKPQISRKRPNDSRRTMPTDDEVDDDVIVLTSEGEDNETDALTGYEIESGIRDFRKQFKTARREKGLCNDHIQTIHSELEDIKSQERRIQDEYSQRCIAGRNEYVRAAIQQDFAAGIKELDQELAEEEDPDTFDPEADVRDYDKIAKSLQVHCVSSRAFQKICGRMQQDTDVPAFTTKQETEIPQLQEHCKQLTEAARLSASRRFLNNFEQLMASIGLWASNDGAGAGLTTDEHSEELLYFERQLNQLKDDLYQAIAEKLDELDDSLEEHVYDKHESAINTASKKALQTSNKWAAPYSEGGLRWQIYRATVRRHGVYQGKYGLRNFNEELLEPLHRRLASVWDKAFQHNLPSILQSFVQTSSDIMARYHTTIEAHCAEQCHSNARVDILKNQLTASEAAFGGIKRVAAAAINEGQKDVNREWMPAISEGMQEAYDLCKDERGTGSFKRMKNHMETHVREEKRSMFEDACEAVHESLSSLIERVKELMRKEVDNFYIRKHEDYLSIIGGANGQDVKLSIEEREVRQELDEVIATVDERFDRISKSKLEDLPFTYQYDGEVDSEGRQGMDAEEDSAEGEFYDFGEESGVDEDEEDGYIAGHGSDFGDEEYIDAAEEEK